MVAMHDDVWDEETQDWAPDEWERQARALIDYRDQVATSVYGPLPEVGTPAWLSSGPDTQAASFARHQQDVSAAQGPAVSNRMAGELGRRRDLVQASQSILRGLSRYRALDPEVQERRRSEAERRRSAPCQPVRVPSQRTSADDAVARVEEASREEPAEWWSSPPADGAARVRGR